MASIKRHIISNIRNIQSGYRLPGKYLILESDDWGSNRISSRESYDRLLKKGILTCPEKYDKYDTIAKAEDLTALYEILDKYKDINGNPAIVSTFINPTNPDFDKIKDSDYSEYFYETFLDTLDKTGDRESTINAWREGINKRYISPEYHGREHLCVPLWMEALKANNKTVLDAFDEHFYSINILPDHHIAKSFRPTLFFNTETEKIWLGKALGDGYELIREIFGIQPITFAPSNGVSSPYFDEILLNKGIVGIHNSRRYEPNGKGGWVKADYAKRNEYQQLMYNRNCVFDPLLAHIDAIDFCLCQIQGAFNWGKAAIISTHRVNYVGGIDVKNRDNGLKMLDSLLKKAIEKWPDIQFISSDEYINKIIKRYG
ncbi:MAG: hypothetical protein PHE51_08745 [Eubacteriales bacterium]|nr:hypothetical protein [Eubacteriales bacterium]